MVFNRKYIFYKKDVLLSKALEYGSMLFVYLCKKYWNNNIGFAKQFS